MNSVSIFTLAVVAVGASVMSARVEAKTIEVVTGGEVTIEVTAPLLDLDLWGTAAPGSPPAELNADGNPVVTLPNIASTYYGGRWNDWYFSKVIDGGYDLHLNGGVYLYPLGESGNPASELTSFDDVMIFPDDVGSVDVPGDVRWNNYVRNDDGSYVNYNTGETVALTAEQIAILEPTQIRTCCRNELTWMNFNTAEGYIDGYINSVWERDTNQDGVIDEDDYFHLFVLGDEVAGRGWELQLTDKMAEYINYGFSAGNDDFPLIADWARYKQAVEDGGSYALGMAGGDVVGYLNWTVETGVADDPTAPVPLPAALPMLVGGLGVLGMLGRRRQQRAR